LVAAIAPVAGRDRPARLDQCGASPLASDQWRARAVCQLSGAIGTVGVDRTGTVGARLRHGEPACLDFRGIEVLGWARVSSNP
jgi:hypothetical protein